MAELLVYSDWHGRAGPRLLGTLAADIVRGHEMFSFAFDEKRIREGRDVAILDPGLSFHGGRQYPVHANFGLFLDSCPDRWGRRLIRRREAIRAGKSGEIPRRLRETDFLLGVYDRTRLGALRFKKDPHGPFLDDDSLLPTPPWTTLRKLEVAARRLSSDDEIGVDDEERWLSLLLAPGSSLGGARPKANVLAPDGSLWIAKFPAKSDEADVGAWEGVAAALARAAGVRIAANRRPVARRRRVLRHPRPADRVLPHRLRPMKRLLSLYTAFLLADEPFSPDGEGDDEDFLGCGNPRGERDGIHVQEDCEERHADGEPPPAGGETRHARPHRPHAFCEIQNS